MSNESTDGTINLDALRRRLGTTRGSLDDWTFLCRSFDRSLDRVDRGEALLLVFAVRLRQHGLRPSAVQRAISELLRRPGDPLADDWVAVKRQRKEVEFHLRETIDLTPLRRNATVGVFTAEEMRALLAE